MLKMMGGQPDQHEHGHEHCAHPRPEVHSHAGGQQHQQAT